MDSLCDGLWLVLWWRPVHFSACRLSALLSPLCSIDLFVGFCARPTSAPRKPSITESNTVQIAHFCRSSSFLLTLMWDRVVSSMAHPEQLGTASRSCRGKIRAVTMAVDKDNGPTSSSCHREGRTSSPGLCPSCVPHPGLYSSDRCNYLPHCQTRFQTQTVGAFVAFSNRRWTVKKFKSWTLEPTEGVLWTG